MLLVDIVGADEEEDVADEEEDVADEEEDVADEVRVSDEESLECSCLVCAHEQVL